VFGIVACIDKYNVMHYSDGMGSDFAANWTTQLRKGLLELCVLSILRDRRLYGYDIVKTLGALDGLVISEGTVYPLLNRLKRESFVSTTIEESPDGPARKYYELTPAGHEQLEWMTTTWEHLVAAIRSLQKGATS
jgi:PadR family transcriptional regulator